MNSSLKAQLGELNKIAAKEIEVDGGQKATVILVPILQLKFFQKTKSGKYLNWRNSSLKKHIVSNIQRILLKPTRKICTKNKQKCLETTL